MNETPAVKSAERNREADGHAQELGQLERVPQKTLEDLAARILEQEHRPPLLMHQRQGSRRPGRLQRIPKCIGVLEPPHTCGRGMLRGGCDDQERGPLTFPSATGQASHGQKTSRKSAIAQAQHS